MHDCEGAELSASVNVPSDLRLFIGTCDILQMHMQSCALLHKTVTGSVHVFV